MNLCRKCSAPLPIQEGPGRKRTMCAECSPPDRRQRRRSGVTRLPVRSARQSLEAATRERLAELGRVDSPEGALALYLAGLLDLGAGSQTAPLSREFRLAVEAASKGVAGASSALDELRKRREQRRGA